MKRLTPGQRLRKWREKLFLSQEKVGKMFGVSKMTISKWEHDKCKPDDLLLVSETTGIKINLLVKKRSKKNG